MTEGEPATCKPPLQVEPAGEAADWLIYDREDGLWWRGNSSGYTAHIKSAGRYTRERAKAIESRSERWPYEDREAGPAQVAVPCPDAFDTLRARAEKAEAERDRERQRANKAEAELAALRARPAPTAEALRDVGSPEHVRLWNAIALNAAVKTQTQDLRARIAALEAENARMRATLTAIDNNRGSEDDFPYVLYRKVVHSANMARNALHDTLRPPQPQEPT